MNDEQDLRDRLRAVEVPPTQVRVDELVPAGRKRAFRRRTAQALGALVLATGVLLAVPAIVTRVGAAPAVAPVAASKAAPTAGASRAVPAVTCKVVTTLKAPSGVHDAGVVSVDPSGRYIIGNGSVGQDFRPVLWTDGVPRALPVPATSVQTSDVNSSGTVVGLYSNGREDSVFKYENGTFTPLRLPAGKWHPYPYPRINTAGDILINVEPSGNSGGKGSKVLMWRAASTSAVELPLPKGANGMDLNDDGTIVGAIYKNGVATFGYAWTQQGKGTKLAVPAGKASAAYGVQGDWVTGGLWEPGSAALWNLRTGTVVDLGGSAADQVNGQGWVVVDGTVRRSDGVVVKLAGGKAGPAKAISDTGLVVGGLNAWQC
jgi:hypothetical protein